MATAVRGFPKPDLKMRVSAGFAVVWQAQLLLPDWLDIRHAECLVRPVFTERAFSELVCCVRLARCVLARSLTPVLVCLVPTALPTMYR